MDRNTFCAQGAGSERGSLSARRAWIEIDVFILSPYTVIVALRKESVDRNQNRFSVSRAVFSRSPQGERG